MLCVIRTKKRDPSGSPLSFSVVLRNSAHSQTTLPNISKQKSWTQLPPSSPEGAEAHPLELGVGESLSHDTQPLSPHPSWKDLVYFVYFPFIEKLLYNAIFLHLFFPPGGDEASFRGFPSPAYPPLNQVLGFNNICWLNAEYDLNRTRATGSLGDPTPVSTGDIRDVGSIPGLGSSSGIGNGNPLQYSCLGNSMDRGVWRATESQRVGHDWSGLTHTHPQRESFLLEAIWFFWISKGPQKCRNSIYIAPVSLWNGKLMPSDKTLLRFIFNSDCFV